MALPKYGTTGRPVFASSGRPAFACNTVPPDPPNESSCFFTRVGTPPVTQRFQIARLAFSVSLNSCLPDDGAPFNSFRVSTSVAPSGTFDIPFFQCIAPTSYGCSYFRDAALTGTVREDRWVAANCPGSPNQSTIGNIFSRFIRFDFAAKANRIQRLEIRYFYGNDNAVSSTWFSLNSAFTPEIIGTLMTNPMTFVMPPANGTTYPFPWIASATVTVTFLNPIAGFCPPIP